LLVDVLQRALSDRLDMSVVAKIADIEAAPDVLARLAPDVVVIGPDADPRRGMAPIRRRLPAARILGLSADLRQLLGPGDDDVAELTIETLVRRLRDD
jgi:DNA-binding NarL/FixJ family response regulator